MHSKLKKVCSYLSNKWEDNDTQEGRSSFKNYVEAGNVFKPFIRKVKVLTSLKFLSM